MLLFIGFWRRRCYVKDEFAFRVKFLVRVWIMERRFSNSNRCYLSQLFLQMNEASNSNNGKLQSIAKKVIAKKVWTSFQTTHISLLHFRSDQKNFFSEKRTSGGNNFSIMGTIRGSLLGWFHRGVLNSQIHVGCRVETIYVDSQLVHPFGLWFSDGVDAFTFSGECVLGEGWVDMDEVFGENEREDIRWEKKKKHLHPLFTNSLL